MTFALPRARGRRPFRKPVVLVLLATAGVGLVSCRDATQITLRVHTDLPCTDARQWQGVAVYVGEPGQDVEQTSPTLVTRACDEDGSVGSLVVVPAGSKSASVGVRVVAGIEVAPEQCLENDYAGCVVARRSLRFTPHHDLELDVELSSSCVSVGCDVTHSCRAGSCQPSEQLASPPPLPVEQPAPVEPSVRCGDDGVRCATSGDVCCLNVDVEHQTTSGDCRPAEQCPPSSIVLRCDDDSDCPEHDASGNAGLCALSYSTPTPTDYFSPDRIFLSECRFAYAGSLGGNFGLGLCQGRTACAGGAFTCRGSSYNSDQLPGYFWCQVIEQ